MWALALFSIVKSLNYPKSVTLICKILITVQIAFYSWWSREANPISVKISNLLLHTILMKPNPILISFFSYSFVPAASLFGCLISDQQRGVWVLIIRINLSERNSRRRFPPFSSYENEFSVYWDAWSWTLHGLLALHRWKAHLDKFGSISISISAKNCWLIPSKRNASFRRN